MKTKILIAVLSIGLFTFSSMQAQEKKMGKKMMKHDSTKMNMKHDKMDSSKMDHNKMDHSKMAKVYECPMHPGVTYDKPGECPKCGMTLVEKKMDKKGMKMKKDMKMKKEENTHEKENKHQEHKH